jgi:hypothetical protein
MRKSRFSENQIITILKEVEKGRAVKDDSPRTFCQRSYLLSVEV